jgi:lipopolysaccharide biosynthesis glycosyltransferase
MKNLIYTCVFFNPKYIELTKILLKSLKIFGKVDNSVDILVITNDEFKDELSTFCKSLDISYKIHVLKKITIEGSKISRYELFRIKNDINLEEYSKILYLDTDVIVQSDIKEIFKYELLDKIYAKDQGDIGCDIYGDFLFNEWRKENSNNYIDKKTRSFCSGVLLFNRCEKVEELFEKTLRHLSEYKKSGKPFRTHIDQPFLIFNTIITNMHDIELLRYKITNSPSINSKKEIICHFAGNTCVFDVKYKSMIRVYNKRIEELENKTIQ